SGIAAVAALIGILLSTGGTTASPGVAPLANGASTPRTPRSGAASLAPSAFAPGHASSKYSPAKPAQREIIVTGTLNLSVGAGDLPSTVDHLESLVAAYGGYVGQSSVVETGRHVGGRLVLDVPASSFQPLVGRARQAGTVGSLTTSDRDVTGQVVDLGARLTALEDERGALEVLLSKSAKVSDLLQVENQIEFVQSEIEQIQGQQRVLSQQVTFSALTVHLAVPTAHHKAAGSGFAHAWHAATSSFVDAAKDFVSVLGDIAFAILAAIAALALAYASWRKGWPVLRRRFV
ncbi:MAG: DUF4349 domain-containing protein, partial [Acidimicrobiales bacterium]